MNLDRYIRLGQTAAVEMNLDRYTPQNSLDRYTP